MYLYLRDIVEDGQCFITTQSKHNNLKMFETIITDSNGAKIIDYLTIKEAVIGHNKQVFLRKNKNGNWTQ